MRKLDEAFMNKYHELRETLFCKGVTMAEYFKTLDKTELITMQKIRNYRNHLAFSYQVEEAAEADVASWVSVLDQALDKIA